MTNVKRGLEAVCSVPSAFGHALHLLEHMTLAGVDCRNESRCRDGARVKAPRRIEVRGALVGAEGVRLPSHPTQEVPLSVRPPGLIGLSTFNQLVDLERVGCPSILEGSVELDTRSAVVLSRLRVVW